MRPFQLPYYLSVWSDSKSLKIVALLFGGFGIVYLAWKYFTLIGVDVDFKYIWLSGHLWSKNVDPYSLQFMDQGRYFFKSFNGQPFYYPPNWWLLSSFFGQFDFQTSLEIWRFLNVFMIIVSTLVLNAALRVIGVNLSWYYLVFYTGLISLMQATAITLHLGQTAILIYFGVCLIIYGVLSSKNWFLVFGFCLILLKPQIGIPLMIAFLPFRKYQKAFFYACGITVLLVLPIFATFDPTETVTNYLSGISKHSGFSSNSSNEISGISYLFYVFADIKLSTLTAVFLSISSVLAIIFIFKNRGGLLKQGDAEKQTILLILSICLVGFLTPLHSYDFIFLAPILLLAAKLGNPFQWLISIPFMILVRVENLVDEISGVDLEKVSFYTVALSMITIFTILIIVMNKGYKKDR